MTFAANWRALRPPEDPAVRFYVNERLVHRASFRLVPPRNTGEIEILFADIHGAFCPLGTKRMGECPINPVSPALANAIAGAASVSVRALPCTPDQIHRPIFE